ncbi:MAG: hypothetical protein Ct9H300mP19_04040 [Dehalococcoidia bacterium]|nr:MAG: hypothetical protein Ct9H300mP19_04040 [Dehalococcoidia bacterium]
MAAVALEEYWVPPYSVIPGSMEPAHAGEHCCWLGCYVLNVQVLRIGFPENLRNPFPPTSESVAIGEPIYVGVCASCHGDNGLGDGVFLLS